ncbi:hypothetical protein ABK905_01575 [Acerihabitans sp. KWT182]|uniref:Uncharacterized protein n=1 Tax=Acerihabitans sp. KWT182 TaxID=3157919 RepID=A0AAU7QCE6_9GAMM
MMNKKLRAKLEELNNFNIDFLYEVSVTNTRLKDFLNTKGFTTSIKEPISINSQIRAVGVLRSMSTALDKAISIKEAASGSDEVINAYNNRFMTGYLGQWHSE